MADHRKLEEAMTVVLRAFVDTERLKGLTVTRHMDPRGPRRVTVAIDGDLDLTEFAMAVNLELETPGVISGR